MLKQKYFLTDFFILSAEKQPIKSSWRKIEWLPTSKYYILESGDLCPCNDLYNKEDIRLFSRISFERKEEIRRFTFECVYYGLMDELEDEGKKKDLGLLLNRT